MKKYIAVFFVMVFIVGYSCAMDSENSLGSPTEPVAEKKARAILLQAGSYGPIRVRTITRVAPFVGALYSRSLVVSGRDEAVHIIQAKNSSGVIEYICSACDLHTNDLEIFAHHMRSLHAYNGCIPTLISPTGLAPLW